MPWVLQSDGSWCRADHVEVCLAPHGKESVFDVVPDSSAHEVFEVVADSVPIESVHEMEDTVHQDVDGPSAPLAKEVVYDVVGDFEDGFEVVKDVNPLPTPGWKIPIKCSLPPVRASWADLLEQEGSNLVDPGEVPFTPTVLPINSHRAEYLDMAVDAKCDAHAEPIDPDVVLLPSLVPVDEDGTLCLPGHKLHLMKVALVGMSQLCQHWLYVTDMARDRFKQHGNKHIVQCLLAWNGLASKRTKFKLEVPSLSGEATVELAVNEPEVVKVPKKLYTQVLNPGMAKQPCLPWSSMWQPKQHLYMGLDCVDHGETSLQLQKEKLQVQKDELEFRLQRQKEMLVELQKEIVTSESQVMESQAEVGAAFAELLSKWPGFLDAAEELWEQQLPSGM